MVMNYLLKLDTGFCKYLSAVTLWQQEGLTACKKYCCSYLSTKFYNLL